MELHTALEAAVGSSLPATLVFDYPTIDALAEHLISRCSPAPQLPAPSSPADGSSETQLMPAFVAVRSVASSLPGQDSGDNAPNCSVPAVDSISMIPLSRCG